MSRILLSTFGSRGDIAPYLAIARQLQTLGHQPTIATAQAFRPMIESAGVQWAFCPPETPDARGQKHMMNRARGDEWLFRRLILPSLKQSVQTLDILARHADVLVTHTASLCGPLVAARRPQLKWTSSAVAPLSLLEPELRPALPVAPWAANFPRFNALLLELLRREFGVWFRPVQSLRRELDLSPGENALWSEAHSPLLALRLWSPQFCGPGARINARATGFCFDDDETVVAPDLARFLESEPLVFCAASFCGDDKWEAGAVQSARALGRRALLLGGPRDWENREIMARRFAPLNQILPRAEAVVHGGGLGVLAQSWRAQVPMLITPRAHDQFDNARRARKLGLARVACARTQTRELEKLLHDGEMKRRTEASGALIAREDGARAAARAVAEIL